MDVLTTKRKLDFTMYLNYVALAYAFILPLSRAGITFFTILMIILWVLEGNFKEKFAMLIRNKMVQVLALFILYNILSLLWAEELYWASKYILRYWHIILVFVLYTSIKKEFIFKIFSAFILGMFISEILSYGIFFDLLHIGHATPENPSPFMHHIEYSIFLAFTAVVLLGYIFYEESRLKKLMYLFFFLTMSGNLFLNAGRTGQIAFLFGLFVLLMMHFKNKVKAFFSFVVLAIFMLTTAFNVSHTFHDRVYQGKADLVSVIENKDYCTSWGSRVAAYIVAKDIIVADPIIGLGAIDNMNAFHHLIEYKYPEMRCLHTGFKHFHNQLLQIITQLGVVGLIIFLSIFYQMYKIPLQAQYFRTIRNVYLAVILFSFIPEVVFPHQFSMTLFALLVGLLLAQSRYENEV